MPNVLCPSCGHAFRAVRCQCRGAIVSARAWELGRWDWSHLYGCFADKVRPMDIDAIVEKNGRFLAIETKPRGLDVLPSGQIRALQELAKLPEFTVVILRGDPDEVDEMEVLGKAPRRPASNGELWQFAADWWTRTANGPRAKKRGA